jgi:phenylacetic acid degradation protein PaaD
MSEPAAQMQLARRCVEALYARDRASQHLGMTIESVGPGLATVTMPVTATMVNGHDICHGGYVVLVADSAFAFACNTYDQVTVAAGLDVTFLRSARLGDVLVATAVERARVGKSGIYDVTVTRRTEGEPEAVAEFRGRSRVVGGTVLAGGTQVAGGGMQSTEE